MSHEGFSRILGFEIKRTERPSTSRFMHFAIRDLELDHLLVVHAGPASLRARRPDHRHRRSGTLTAEIDRSYEAYKALPLDTEDEWGNLADFLDATRTT